MPPSKHLRSILNLRPTTPLPTRRTASTRPENFPRSMATTTTGTPTEAQEPQEQQQENQQTQQQQEKQTPLPLPEPPSSTSSTSTPLPLNQSISLPHLGPLVVNKDGTLSRIANWEAMSEIERANTVRILGRRNGVRLEGLRAQEKGEEK